MTPDFPPALKLAALPVEIALMMTEAALNSAAAAAAVRRRRRAPKRGLTLQPGPDTPLWNEVVRQARPHLRQRGSKSLLARRLGLSRHRLYVCLTAGRGMFDAERTLMLLAWLGALPRSPRTPGRNPIK